VHPQANPATQAPQQGNGWQQQPGLGRQSGFPQQGYGAQAPNSQANPQTDYGEWSQLQANQADHQGFSEPPDPYAPQFEPYVPTRPAYGRQQAAPGFGAQPAPQWPGQPQGFDAAAAMEASRGPQAAPQFGHHAGSHERPYQEPDFGNADWPAEPEIGFGNDPYSHPQGGAELGFAQPEGGELDAAAYEDDGEYEEDYAPRGRRPVLIAAALVGAILVGGGMAYGYKKMTASGVQGTPPVIKSEAAPAKTKPADAGGKQFPYSDTKILGRLGDGTSPAAAGESQDTAAAAPSPSDAAANGAPDEGGTRKVATLVVGRDGSIQPPPAEPVSAPLPPQGLSVPGTSVVDVFGANRGQGAGGPPPPPNHDHDAAAARPAPRPVTADEMPAPAKKVVTPVKIAKVNSVNHTRPANATTGSIDERDDAAAPAAAAHKPKRVARAETTATDANPDPAPVTASGGVGFVAVLASVPKSANSRMDALKRFADMQQKYSAALSGKTPDVAEANLGAKGSYHRLIVGPPASREKANAVCIELKAQGYNGCWVTSY
jgi:hypothetical protein